MFIKKVFIVSASLRGGSNSELLARSFAKGASEAGNQVEFLSLKNFNLKFCIGCLACQNTGNCVLNDDMQSVIDKVQKSDVLVFATPVYYYEMCGQLKTFLDRLNPLYIKNNEFKDIYLLGACYDDRKEAFDRTINGLGGWIECFEDVKLKNTLLATSTNEPNSLSENFKKLAYDMGKSV